MNTEKLTQRAQQCLSKASPIPSSPLWHMGKIATFESQDSFDLLQRTIDYLTCKGQNRLAFNSDEKEFLIELYESFWWGGKTKGFWEAAQLADHYLRGNGLPLQIHEEVYKTSVIVQNTKAAIKEYITELVKKKQSFNHIRSDHFGFRNSRHFGKLLRGRRNPTTQGYLINSGLIYAEQANQRLQKADNRFYLDVKNTLIFSKVLKSHWRVDNTYDFEPFSTGKWTELPLAKGKILKLPDGLSQYVTVLNIAKEFKYWAEWDETWELHIN